MIATRFSSVGQVASVAVAALLCYLVSQSVAAERAGLAKVDRQIASEQDAIAKLSTEISTRSRLTQIESWNRQLALQAPRPGQYVDNGVQLASLYAHDSRPQLPLDPSIVAPHGPIQQVSLPAPSASAPAPTVPAPAPVPAIGKALPAAKPLAARSPIQEVVFHPAAPKRKAGNPPAAKPDTAPRPDLAAEPLLHTAAFVRPQTSRLDEASPPIAPTAFHKGAGSLLSADIAGLAKAEQAKHRKDRGTK